MRNINGQNKCDTDHTEYRSTEHPAHLHVGADSVAEHHLHVLVKPLHTWIRPNDNQIHVHFTAKKKYNERFESFLSNV